MNRKKVVTAVCLVLVSLVFAGCGSSDKLASDDSNTIAENESLSDNIPETSADAKTSGNGLSDDSETDEMANPMVEYKTIPEIEHALGFDPLYLPESSGYTGSEMYVIGESLADLRYISKNGGKEEISVRSALKDSTDTEDVSGYYGDDWHDRKVSNTIVGIGGGTADADNTFFARWSNDKYLFSVSGDLDEAAFMDIVDTLVIVTENNYKADAEADEESETLPEFNYVGNDEIARICSEAAKQLYKGYSKADVMIPAPVVADTSTNGDITTIYANIWVYGYDLDGTTLECNNGGANPCIITVDGSKITDIQVAYTEDDEKKLFSDKKILSMLHSDDEDFIRKSWIQMYVENYGLNIDSYKDYGQEKVMLFSE